MKKTCTVITKILNRNDTKLENDSLDEKSPFFSIISLLVSGFRSIVGGDANV